MRVGVPLRVACRSAVAPPDPGWFVLTVVVTIVGTITTIALARSACRADRCVCRGPLRPRTVARCAAPGVPPLGVRTARRRRAGRARSWLQVWARGWWRARWSRSWVTPVLRCRPPPPAWSRAGRAETRAGAAGAPLPRRRFRRRSNRSVTSCAAAAPWRARSSRSAADELVADDVRGVLGRTRLGLSLQERGSRRGRRERTVPGVRVTCRRVGGGDDDGRPCRRRARRAGVVAAPSARRGRGSAFAVHPGPALGDRRGCRTARHICFGTLRRDSRRVQGE